MKSFFLLIVIFMNINIKSEEIMETKQVKKIETELAPAPIGPYSQAVLANNLLFISGQIPFDIKKNELVNDIKDATNLIMTYLQAILNEAGMNFTNVVKTTIYLVDMKDFPLVNETYGSYFKNINILPARETVQVAALPKGARVEISMIAIK
jgi:2-iminobutanoate/2-iminopropanoate deaminase